MGRIAEETIDRIRERVDIVELISSYMPLKRSGGNYQGLCPFHGEKTPSFNVNPARQIFHCFGCGVGGNAVSFVMKMEGLAFPEAVRRLGEKVGIEVEADEETDEQLKRRDEQARLLRASEAAAAVYEKVLLKSPQGETGRRYLQQRGYDSAMAKRFRLGVAPDRSAFLGPELDAAGISRRDAEAIGLLRPGRDGREAFDLFRHRLIFPIEDERGRIVAFGGRALGDAQPKYLNSPESLLYHKGRILYGFFQAKESIRREQEAIVVEGYFDLLALHRAGFTRSVATCGTALTPEQARMIKRLAPRVLLLFDQDSAGQKANLRAMEVFLAEGVSPFMVALEPGEDPDSFLSKKGEDAMRERLLAARPALEIFIETTLAQHGDAIEGRARAAEAIVPKIRLLTSELERNLYFKELARRTGIDPALLQRGGRLSPAVPANSTRAQLPATSTATAVRPRPLSREAARLIKTQELLLQLLLLRPELRSAVEDPKAIFPDPDCEKIAVQALDLGKSGAHIDAMQLMDRLDADGQSRLSAVLLHEERGIDETSAAQIFADCCRTIERDRLQQQSRELTARLKSAETAGDHAAIAGLQAEQVEINRRLKSGNSL